MNFKDILIPRVAFDLPARPLSFGIGNFALADANADALSPTRSGIAQLAAVEDITSDNLSLSKSVGHVHVPVLAR